MIKVQAILSFEGVRKGDTARLEPNDRVLALIKAGYFKVVDDGAVHSGPSGSSGGKSRGGKGRAGNRRDDGGEPGQAFGSGGYGTPEVVSSEDAVPSEVPSGDER